MNTLINVYEQACIKNKHIYPFTFYFNKCKLTVNKNSNYESVSREYFNTVDLSQFEGWK
jgi:hypothetical protein